MPVMRFDPGILCTPLILRRKRRPSFLTFHGSWEKSKKRQREGDFMERFYGDFMESQVIFHFMHPDISFRAMNKKHLKKNCLFFFFSERTG